MPLPHPVVGGHWRVVLPSVQPRVVMNEEDREYEEWVRQRKIKAGIDPDQTAEDVGNSRRAESAIYTVGGAITVLVPLIAGIWAYNEGYLTPQ